MEEYHHIINKLIKIKCFETQHHQTSRFIPHYVFTTKKRWNFLQGYGVQRLDMGLVYKSSVTCGIVCSYEHAQASDQETLDLHNVTLT